MNERIRELYEQARLHAKSIDADIDPKGWMDEYHRKFAELIVRECIDQCVHTNHNNQWDKGIAWAVGQIKQHFGVDE